MRFYEKGMAEHAANAIVFESANLWKEKEDVIDDITCVVVFMDAQMVERSINHRNLNN